MMTRHHSGQVNRNKAVIIFLLFFVLCSSFIKIDRVTADDDEAKIVRVGWYESAFNRTDELGRRTGFAYEYQQKIAAYTGWKYEYVKGSWSDLMEMLKAGEIDLMSDVSYTEERAKVMLYSSLPMGSEAYYLFVNEDEEMITADDVRSVNGKKLGVNKNSIQETYLRNWAKENNVSPLIVELTTSEGESMEMLYNGEIDAYVGTDSYDIKKNRIPVFKIGSSDFFFAINKDRPDLLEDINYAMTKILDEDRYYNQWLFEKYGHYQGSNAYLTTSEKNWVAGHGTVRIGYRKDSLPFCGEDESGVVTGALANYIQLAIDCIRNADISFVAIAYDDFDEAYEALMNKEIDCIFPVYMEMSEAEDLDVSVTNAVMETEMNLLTNRENYYDILNHEEAEVFVEKGNENYARFLKDVYPGWNVTYFEEKNMDDCLKDVNEGTSDGILISNYHVTEYDNIARKYRLSSLSTKEMMGLSFIVRKSDDALYSILNKTINQIPQKDIESSLSSYMEIERKISFMDYLEDNWFSVMTFIIIVFSVMLFLLIGRLSAEEKINESRELISATEYDPLTKLYNKNFFFEYANRMYQSDPKKPMDAIVMNIEKFHTVNAMNGMKFGDMVLEELGNEIRKFLEDTRGIAGRSDADRFYMYCEHQDDYQKIFDFFQRRLNDFSQNISIRLRMGVMPYQEGLEPLQLIDQARTACNMARGDYKTRLKIFDEKIREREIMEQRLLNDFRPAIENEEFEVYYQPKYDIQCDPPVLRSAEALIRWNHPAFGMIAPDNFIPLFERNGQISTVDNYVWRKVTEQIAAWRDEYGITLPVSVNLSRIDVFDPMLELVLSEMLENSRLERKYLKLEVTESAYTEDAEQVIFLVNKLHKDGYEIEMDDFGTGYSSLNMLTSMPVDVLKMDRSFIINIEHDKKDIQVVELILGIARSLNVPVVAEGVETEAQLKILKDLGCNIVQGYYFSKPLPAKEFEEKILQKHIKSL
ncbi:MAG: EAL domain-containing protein [Erysipelotrichaceae bacterium]|nr:EAL domain-containing protein [Erysipelotrichaceae bacterium]MBQ6494313.1 EAL domain-containing protein [Erysipelotrichaceae bacterium]